MSSERESFEQWYAENAFNYGRDPIGSRECGLQWAAWQGRAQLAQPVQAVDVGAIREVIAEIERIVEDESVLARIQFPLLHASDKFTCAISGEKAGREKYRLLDLGDVVEPDDEFIDDNAVNWVRAGSTKGGHLFIGMHYRIGVFKAARRAIASPTPDKEGL